MAYMLALVVIETGPDTQRYEVHLCKAEGLGEATQELEKSFIPAGIKFKVNGLLELAVPSNDEALDLIHQMSLIKREVPDTISRRLAYLMAASFVWGWNSRNTREDQISPENFSRKSSDDELLAKKRCN